MYVRFRPTINKISIYVLAKYQAINVAFFAFFGKAVTASEFHFFPLPPQNNYDAKPFGLEGRKNGRSWFLSPSLSLL